MVGHVLKTIDYILNTMDILLNTMGFSGRAGSVSSIQRGAHNCCGKCWRADNPERSYHEQATLWISTAGATVNFAFKKWWIFHWQWWITCKHDGSSIKNDGFWMKNDESPGYTSTERKSRTWTGVHLLTFWKRTCRNRLQIWWGVWTMIRFVLKSDRSCTENGDSNICIYTVTIM